MVTGEVPHENSSHVSPAGLTLRHRWVGTIPRSSQKTGWNGAPTFAALRSLSGASSALGRELRFLAPPRRL